MQSCLELMGAWLEARILSQQVVLKPLPALYWTVLYKETGHGHVSLSTTSWIDGTALKYRGNAAALHDNRTAGT